MITDNSQGFAGFKDKIPLIQSTFPTTTCAISINSIGVLNFKNRYSQTFKSLCVCKLTIV